MSVYSALFVYNTPVYYSRQCVYVEFYYCGNVPDELLKYFSEY